MVLEHKWDVGELEKQIWIFEKVFTLQPGRSLDLGEGWIPS